MNDRLLTAMKSNGNVPKPKGCERVKGKDLKKLHERFFLSANVYRESSDTNQGLLRVNDQLRNYELAKAKLES